MRNGKSPIDALNPADVAAGMDVITQGCIAQINGDRSCGTSCSDAVHPAGVPDRSPPGSLTILQRQCVGVVAGGSVRIDPVHPLQGSNIQSARRFQEAIGLD